MIVPTLVGDGVEDDDGADDDVSRTGYWHPERPQVLDANKGLNSKTLHFLPFARFLGL